MKKITIIAVAFVAISFASCKKAITCTCSSSGTGWSQTDVTTYDKISKGKQRTVCPKTRTYTGTSGTSTTETCVIS